MSGPSFRIGNRSVGGDAPTYLIAELSANHGQRLDIALKTVEAAAKAGADAIKLQTYTPDTLTLKSSAPPFVVKTKNVWSGRTLHDLYAEAMTPWEWHAEIKRLAESLGLACFSTPFDPTAVAFLEDLGVPVFKIASFEIIDLPLVERVARSGRPMIISTGMATLGDIEAAVNVCREAGNQQLALLRCVSSYPAQPESMNLTSYTALKAFGTVVGLSDHTRDHTVAIASVALGAKVIEKHFILDRSIGGPDSFFSLEPDEFRAMVTAVRAAESAMGAPRFGPSPDERASTAFRRSLFVARDVPAGAVLTCEDVRSVRPADGLHPRHLPNVLGRTAARSLTAGAPFSWDCVGPHPSRPSVALRAATSDDGEMLLAWRNDTETRANSIRTDPVSLDEHRAWLARTLAAEDRSLLIGELEGRPVGVVRLDGHGHGEWEVSITIAPQSRGRGLAAALLVAAEQAARSSGCVRLVAQIRTSNARSRRAFEQAGYYGFTQHALPEGAFWRCERRVVEYG